MDKPINNHLRKEVLKLLDEINYDYVTYHEDDNYLCVSKIASILKYHGFTKREFYIPAKESIKYTDEVLSPIWELASGTFSDISYLFLLRDTRFMDEDTECLISFDQIESKAIEWLIPNFIPKANITLISGDGGSGKGFIVCNIIKRLIDNVPALFEDEDTYDYDSFCPGKVIYFTSEDDLSTIIKGRLNAIGVDQRFLRTVELTNPKYKDIRYDNELLDKFILLEHPKLIIFDPFQAFIDPKINLSSRNQVRDVLSNLIRLGSLYGTTFILISHTNKSDKRSGRGRIADTADLWDISRCVFITGETKDREIRYFSQEKNNYGKLQDTVLFSISDSRITYEGTTKCKDDYYSRLRISTEEPSDESKLNKCMNEILEILRNNNGQISSNELSNLLGSHYSQATIKRAKNNLTSNNRIKSYRNQPLDNDKRGTIIQLLGQNND